jgi:CheY-like chemotaxis protein
MIGPPGVPPVSPKVLVVDDTPLVRAVLRRSLEAAGYTVQEANDGQGALAQLALGTVDLVLSDIRMPNMDGCALALEIRRRAPQVPILFVSGYDAHLPGVELPAPVLTKPFTPAHLIERVRQMLTAP